MNALRKSFSDDPLFPFDLVYKDTKSPQRELPDHLHDRYELVYVYGGNGTMFIDQKFYDMAAGDLFIIPGNSIHRAFPDPVDPVTSTAVFFAPSLISYEKLDDSYSSMRCFELAKKRKNYKLETAGQLRGQTEAALEDIHLELERKIPGYRHAISLQFQQWMLRVNRHMITTHSDVSDDVRIGPLWMREILHYIAQHPNRDLGLSALAQQSSVTGAHFSRVFKQLTGMNVTDYVNAKRIAQAKELLLETDESIGLIADRCGFESLPHFHRIFKRMTGLTPGVYRRDIPERGRT
ncbi:AraC family transcriptional regulator [Cohnella silvisoli]|uniref:AraC family transcriptional regulator n=1 Tax=Cohnella silvisoli TaxID=2873699 RepID=A0ABV1L158_9BACL|nr:AraC family transcriptional regulator [Cohnella silvisoli]MCD9025522.1 AraC family transcriptional regulator [Cohnella silvisoli]